MIDNADWAITDIEMYVNQAQDLVNALDKTHNKHVKASKKEITAHHQKIVPELRARRDRCVRKITKKEKLSSKAL